MDQQLNEFDRYESEVRRTMAMANDRERVLIFALGLCGEAAELLVETEKGDATAVTKELGDLLWYLTALASEYGISLRTVAHAPTFRALQRSASHLVCREASSICVIAGQIGDLVKKQIGHGHALDTAVLQRFLAVGLLLIAEQASVFCRTNIEKLRKRYPDGFSEERSRSRGAE